MTYFAGSPELANSAARSSSTPRRDGLVPDDLTVRIFERHLNILEMQELVIPEQHILILDGLPRNYAQAERLSGFIDVMQIFHLKINDTAKAIERLRARALRENRLDDMSEDVIRRRLQTYYDETFQTLSYYPTDLIFDVDGGKTHDRRALRHRHPARPDQETLNGLARFREGEPSTVHNVRFTQRQAASDINHEYAQQKAVLRLE